MITRAVAAGDPARGPPATRSTAPIPTARRHPRPRAGLRARRRVQPHRHHRGRHAAGGPARAVTAAAGLAAGQRRSRQPRGSAGTPGRCSTIVGDTDTGHHHLLVRRNDKTGELAYYRCYSPGPVTLHDYVRVAGWRWKIEESFQTGKGLAGLDEHQVRTWTSWHRWVTLAMLAHAFLAVTTAAQRRTEASAINNVESLITLTVNEFRRLFVALLLRRCTRSPTSWPGRPGGENTKPEPAPATTANNINNNEHDLRL